MCNMIDYLMEHGDKTMQERPFAATDALVLSQLSYVNWSGIVTGRMDPERGITLNEILRRGKQRQIARGSFYGAHNLSLVCLCAASRRFSDLKLYGYRDCCDGRENLQFAALSFLLPGKKTCVVFRGTDESLNGWQENFSMVYRFPVPAQEYAASYLHQAARISRGPVYVSGHSKGGNLAVYAAAYCGSHAQCKISRVYNFDGPGFWPEFFQTPRYKNIADKVRKYVVPESFVGLLLEDDGKSFMVESTGHGMAQHDPFKWELKECKLKKASHYDLEKRQRGEALNKRILSIPKEDAKVVIDTFFDVARKRGIGRVTQMRPEDTIAVLKTFHDEKLYNRESVLVLGNLVFYFIGVPYVGKKSGKEYGNHQMPQQESCVES